MKNKLSLRILCNLPRRSEKPRKQKRFVIRPKEGVQNLLTKTLTPRKSLVFPLYYCYEPYWASSTRHWIFLSYRSSKKSKKSREPSLSPPPKRSRHDRKSRSRSRSRERDRERDRYHEFTYHEFTVIGAALAITRTNVSDKLLCLTVEILDIDEEVTGSIPFCTSFENEVISIGSCLVVFRYFLPLNLPLLFWYSGHFKIIYNVKILCCRL